MASIINEAECFDSKHSYIEKILEYREESKQAINAFVELICVNQFIIPDNLLSDLQKFEHEIKDVFIMYNDEKNNIINDINSVDQNQQNYEAKKNELFNLSQIIENKMKEYIESLQVIEK